MFKCWIRRIVIGVLWLGIGVTTSSAQTVRAEDDGYWIESENSFIRYTAQQALDEIQETVRLEELN